MQPHAAPTAGRLPPDEAFAYLERYPEHGGPAERVALSKLPFTIGRADIADYVVYSGRVSKQHAALVGVRDGVAVRDLASTNGTYVNGERTTERVLRDGDILHLAHVEFCFRQAARPAVTRRAAEVIERTQAVPVESPISLIRGRELLRDMIRLEAVAIRYQPIVDTDTRAAVGYEALARGAHPGLARAPDLLLRLAEQCGLAVELSQLFAQQAAVHAHKLPVGAKLFFNLHPHHMASPDLEASLSAVRALAPVDRSLVIEIPEASVTDVATMADTSAIFTSLGFEFAYDDFGAGQGRLLELTDVPPHYLKFDRALLHGIEGVRFRQDMVTALLVVVRARGICAIAEGVETEAGAAVCHELDFDLLQGFLFGQPA